MMIKFVNLIFLTLCIFYMLNTVHAMPNREKSNPNKELAKALQAKFLEEIEKLDREISENLLNTRMLENSEKSKRSNIDERLFELQAKLLLTNAYQNTIGHGKFNFDEIDKRSDDRAISRFFYERNIKK